MTTTMGPEGLPPWTRPDDEQLVAYAEGRRDELLDAVDTERKDAAYRQGRADARTQKVDEDLVGKELSRFLAQANVTGGDSYVGPVTLDLPEIPRNEDYGRHLQEAATVHGIGMFRTHGGDRWVGPVLLAGHDAVLATRRLLLDVKVTTAAAGDEGATGSLISDQWLSNHAGPVCLLTMVLGFGRPAWAGEQS